jgi:hypothetical protein
MYLSDVGVMVTTGNDSCYGNCTEYMAAAQNAATLLTV